MLNKSHPIGKSKAEFIEKNLGYTKSDVEKFHNAISDVIDGKIPDKIEETNYGSKQKFTVKVIGKDNKYHSVNLVIAVQNDNGKTTWRLITITPGKKEK